VSERVSERGSTPIHTQARVRRRRVSRNSENRTRAKERRILLLLDLATSRILTVATFLLSERSFPVAVSKRATLRANFALPALASSRKSPLIALRVTRLGFRPDGGGRGERA